MGMIVGVGANKEACRLEFEKGKTKEVVKEMSATS